MLRPVDTNMAYVQPQTLTQKETQQNTQTQANLQQEQYAYTVAQDVRKAREIVIQTNKQLFPGHMPGNSFLVKLQVFQCWNISGPDSTFGEFLAF